MAFIRILLINLMLCLMAIGSVAQTTGTCGDGKVALTTTKSGLGIVIYSNDPETIWNAFRLANFSISQKDTVKIFLLGKGVEAEKVSTAKFNIKGQMEDFVKGGGQILACGTCLKIRKESGTELCPLSTLADLYNIISQSNKVITF